jgi:peptidoglycan/xylan/chitin deacetylase (PgdA/CDA1 family)
MSTLMSKARAVAFVTGALFASDFVSTSLASIHCPDNPTALGTSRVLSIDPRVSSMLGKAQYQQSLRLNRRELVLTFDNGPSFPYTEMILKTLADECVRATFFTVGSKVAQDPEQVRRIALQGHTIGSQTYNHVSLAKLSPAEARREVDSGVEALNAALQDEHRPTPFFRAPMFHLPQQTARYVSSRGMSIWSMDVDSRDWREPTEQQFVDETIKGLEKSGGGIVVMQDIHPVTARALPLLFDQLKRRNFRVVHVVAHQPQDKAQPVGKATPRNVPPRKR